MMRHSILFAFVFTYACANNQYRFEQIDRDPAVALPLKLTEFSGLRDGAAVNAEARFGDGNDSVTMTIMLVLRPPAEFRSGAYHGIIGGKMVSGTVECPSLDFQGGQTALPAVGGTFILKDGNRPAYRVRIPATQLTRRPQARL